MLGETGGDALVVGDLVDVAVTELARVHAAGLRDRL